MLPYWHSGRVLIGVALAPLLRAAPFGRMTEWTGPFDSATSTFGEAMRRKCPNCRTEQEIVEGPPRAVLHALPQLASPLEIEVPHRCTKCGRKVGASVQFATTNKKVVLSPPMEGESAPEWRRGHVYGLGGTMSTFLNYPAVWSSGRSVLFPAHDGRLSAGHAIDRYGDPDLMAEFAAQYLKQYWTIVPKGRLPQTLSEMMPALNLLVNAAELAMKADLIRSGKESGRHALPSLFQRLDCTHREEIERRFADGALNSDLRTLGCETPSVESVLAVYEHGWNPVYVDTRYFAEPTTKVKSEGAKGGNLVKDVPYPIFLPVLVQTILDVYPHFSGTERLKRLGAQVGHGSRGPGNDQHRDWGLVPSSLGLVVIQFAQLVARNEEGEYREEFRRFIDVRSPLYRTSWMYGGNVLLFYRVGDALPEDGDTVIDGMKCKVWYAGSLGMHPRDLYLLADRLEAPGEVDEFKWVSAQAR